MVPPGSESDSADSDEGDDHTALAAEERAAKIRKKAGLPELDPDMLPSTIALKMLSLIKSYLFFFLSSQPFLDLYMTL